MTSLRRPTEAERLFDVAWGCSLTTNGTDGPVRKRTTTNANARTYGLGGHPGYSANGPSTTADQKVGGSSPSERDTSERDTSERTPLRELTLIVDTWAF